MNAVGARSVTITATASAVATASDRAASLAADRRARAEALGAALADDVNDPSRCAAALDEALESLADPVHRLGQERIAPGIGPTFGVRWPLVAAVSRGFRATTRDDRASTLLFVADRLLRAERLEPRWFAIGLLERLVGEDPERSWQLLRRAARTAGDWITVDALAHPCAIGVLAEPYRWAELEQLVYSPSRWERRLVAATVATMPFVRRGPGRQRAVAAEGLPLLGLLIGDAEPDVQKALAWAYRSLLLVDARAVTDALTVEAELAAGTSDGHRAWVIREILSKLEPGDSEALRSRLDGIRRHPGSPSTSRAQEAAARFGALPDPAGLAEPPLT